MFPCLHVILVGLYDNSQISFSIVIEGFAVTINSVNWQIYIDILIEYVYNKNRCSFY